MLINVFKNNTAELTFEFTQNGSIYPIPIGTNLKFTVKKFLSDSDDKILFSKLIDGDGSNTYTILLSPSDTNIEPGSYFWDIKNVSDNLTLCFPDRFIINEVVLING